MNCEIKSCCISVGESARLHTIAFAMDPLKYWTFDGKFPMCIVVSKDPIDPDFDVDEMAFQSTKIVMVDPSHVPIT